MISGQKLRAFRERRRIAPSVVARELKLSRSAVSDMERRSVSIRKAQDYVNAVLRIEAAGKRAAVVEFKVAMSVPMSGWYTGWYTGLASELVDLIGDES